MLVADDPQPPEAGAWPAVVPMRRNGRPVEAGAARRTAPATRQHRTKRLRITLDQLRIFSAVAEREHLTAAAQALHLSQGSVSVQVRRLERALGLPLLHRVGRNIRLTDVGRAVHRQAVEALKSAQSVEDLATAYLQEDRGQVTVAAGMVIGAHRLSGWLAPFVQGHPHVEVHIAITPLQMAMDSLAAGEVDVVVVGAEVPSANVESIILERTELVIVVASQHPLAAHPTPLTQLGQYRYLAHERGSATQLHAGAVLGGHEEHSPTTELEEGTLQAALHTGLGFAVMPRSIVEGEIAAGRLTVIDGPGEPIAVGFTAVRRPGPHTPVVDAFWAHLKAVSTA